MDEHDHGKCLDLLGSLSEYVDGALEETLCADLERHLRDCANCQVVVDTLRKTVELYHREADVESMPEDVRLRLFHRLNLDEYRKTRG